MSTNKTPVRLSAVSAQPPAAPKKSYIQQRTPIQVIPFDLHMKINHSVMSDDESDSDVDTFSDDETDSDIEKDEGNYLGNDARFSDDEGTEDEDSDYGV
jgi:hypothetical protein